MTTMNTTTQATRILAHLKHGGTITTKQADRWFGCMRLSARIKDLRLAGHTIESERVKVGGKCVARYRIN